MKDFISKVTFGFLMAQFLPGAMVVIAMTCVVISISSLVPNTLDTMVQGVTGRWFNNPLMSIFFAFIAVAVGMVIHGLNWIVLAWLEKKYDSSRKSFWHKWPIIIQILLAPIKMILEVLWILLAPNIDILTMKENAPNLHSEQMQQFNFLQDFYLHFAQFYAHCAYALLVITLSSIICCLQHPSWLRLALTITLYLLTSVFFLMGRIQLGSLFKAEEELKNGSIDKIET